MQLRRGLPRQGRSSYEPRRLRIEMQILSPTMAVTIMAAFEKRTTQMIGGRHAGRSGGLGARCGCAGQAGGSATLQVLQNSADDSRLLDAGDDLDLSATVLAAVGF